jgi:hypothetical protein
MAIPSSGPLSLTTIQTEFGGTNPIGLSEYYAGGGLVPAGTTGTYGAVPSSGTISIQNFYGTANVYAINNSLRFRRSVSAHLSRTSSFSGTTNTISFWIKRGELGTRQVIFGWSDNSSNALYFQFDTSNRLELYNLTSGSNNLSLITTQVFRDPSAWYHFVVVLNTTQATASNRAQFYVNGSQITAFATATYPAQNTSLQLGNSRLWNIGREGNTGNNPGDYYLAEWNFIDGQALTPSSFGETNATTGSWYPKAYTGTYGTNGFYLKFSSIALTSGSNTGLGQDFSGNGNYWNTNNISVTAGTTYDAMTDSPTPTSATVGNYAVINPLWKGSAVTITNGNLSYSASGATNSIAYSTFGITSGKWYAEWTQGTTPGGGAMYVGISLDSINPNHSWLGQNAGEYSYLNSNGFKANNNVQTAYGATWGINDVIGVAFDADARTITFYKNGVSQGVAYSSIPAGNYYFANGNNPGSTVTGNWNFGQRAFTGSLPTGFSAVNTFNIPTSTVVQGSSYMVATLYTGNGGTQTITNASGLRPDLVWFKERSSNSSNWLFDTIRGIYNRLSSNETTAEGNQTNSLTAFNSNGFSVGSDVAGNESGQTYVAWQWIANASTVTNTSGTISSQVRVNTTSGFSIVTYTGTGANATVGHGLGVAPKMVIVKIRNVGGGSWATWHTSIPNTQYLLLDSTAGVATAAPMWNSTTPTSTVFSIGTNGNVNNPGNTMVAYLWAEIAGFSKFGSYTGNGSADGVFVYTGFRPKYLMVKSSSAVGNWPIVDTSRNTYNVTNLSIDANNFDAEQTGTASTMPTMDLLSNGFKLRTTSAGGNGSGVTYIYMAFAENPFKNANAR